MGGQAMSGHTASLPGRRTQDVRRVAERKAEKVSITLRPSTPWTTGRIFRSVRLKERRTMATSFIVAGSIVGMLILLGLFIKFTHA